MRRHRATSSSCSARARSGVGSSRSSSSAQRRFTAVGRDEASTSYAVVEILSARRSEREPVRSRDTDRRGAADSERADRVGDLGRRRAPQLDLLFGQAPLVEHDHGVRLEANDALGG